MTLEDRESEYPRSKYEAEFEILYAANLAGIHARLYRNIHRAVGWINVFSGSGAVYAVLQGFPRFAVICGILTTALSVYDLYFKPGDTAAAHEHDKKEFLKLKARSSKLTLDQIDAAATKIRIECAATLDVLGRPVYNDTCRTLGRKAYLLNLTHRERLARWVA